MYIHMYLYMYVHVHVHIPIVILCTIYTRSIDAYLFILTHVQDIMKFFCMFLELKDLVTAQAFRVSLPPSPLS